jgi:hypothetical protein
MKKVIISDRDSKVKIKEYQTVKESQEFDTELTEAKLSIAREFNIPFKWQEVEIHVL